MQKRLLYAGFQAIALLKKVKHPASFSVAYNIVKIEI